MRFGSYFSMKRSPFLLRRMPPSPRTASVTRIPCTPGGQTIPVGWNCTNSMSSSSAPASYASAMPSPVHSQEFEVIFQDLPMPPVAITIDFALNMTKRPALAPVAERAGDAVAVLQQARDRALHVNVEAQLHAAILQRANHFQAGAVADVAEPLVGVAAERALQNVAVFGAIEKRAPLLEFAHAVRRFLRVQLRHAPVVQELSAAHGVAEMRLPVVGLVHVGHCRGEAAFGHHGVRFAEQRFANHADAARPAPALRSRRASPAPPAPMISTSCSWVSYLDARSQESNVLDHAAELPGGCRDR